MGCPSTAGSVARPEARRDLRPRRRGGRLDVQDVREGRAPPARRRPDPPLHRPHPEDQPDGGRHDRAGPSCGLDRLAKKLPLDAPWTASKAAEWDQRSLAWYLEHTGIRTAIGRDLFEMAIRGLFAGDLDEVSFLNLLMLVRGHGSINTLFSIEGGAQENLVDGGAGSIARRVADELGDAVRLSAPVRSVTQRDDHVVVEAGDLMVSARARGRRASRPRSRSRSSSIPRCPTIASRSTATRSPDRRRRRSSCTTSRSGGPTGSAVRPPSRARRRR